MGDVKLPLRFAIPPARYDYQRDPLSLCEGFLFLIPLLVCL